MGDLPPAILADARSFWLMSYYVDLLLLDFCRFSFALGVAHTLAYCVLLVVVGAVRLPLLVFGVILSVFFRPSCLLLLACFL